MTGRFLVFGLGARFKTMHSARAAASRTPIWCSNDSVAAAPPRPKDMGPFSQGISKKGRNDEVRIDWWRRCSFVMVEELIDLMGKSRWLRVLNGW